MDEEFINKDPLAKRKKRALTVLVVCTGGLIICTFLIFGKLTRDFLVFDANRSMASQELKNLQSQIATLEDRRRSRESDIEEQLSKRMEQVRLLDEIYVKRKAAIDSQQQQVDEYEALSEKLDAVKNDHLQALDALKSISYKALVERGSIPGLKTEKDALIAQKLSLQQELAALNQRKDTTEKELAQFTSQILSAKQERSSVLTETDEARKALAYVSTNLTNQNIKVTRAQDAISKLEEETSRIKETHDSFAAKAILARETAKAKRIEKEELESEILDLTQKKEDIVSDIKELELRKRNAQSQARAAEEKARQALGGRPELNSAVEAGEKQSAATISTATSSGQENSATDTHNYENR